MIASAESGVVRSADGHMAPFGADPGFMPQIGRLLERLLATQ